MYLLNSNILKKTLFSLRQIVSLKYRRKILSNINSYEIEKLEKIRKKKIIRILDFGSGYNPDLIKLITKKLSNKYKNTNFIVYCYDFYNDKELLGSGFALCTPTTIPKPTKKAPKKEL